MSVRKYLFWESKDGIRTYKVIQNGTFELMHPLGKDIFSERNWEKFFQSWFLGSAAITEDEFIDFCFLSDTPITSPVLDYNYNTANKSSWNKEEIGIFFEKYINANRCEVFYAENKSFQCQKGNLLNNNGIKKMFVKCIPEFSLELTEKIKPGTEETSLLCRYFKDNLKKLSCN